MQIWQQAMLQFILMAFVGHSMGNKDVRRLPEGEKSSPHYDDCALKAPPGIAKWILS